MKYCLSPFRQLQKKIIKHTDNGSFLFTILESGKSNIKTLADSMSGEDLLPASQKMSFHLILTGYNRQINFFGRAATYMSTD